MAQYVILIYEDEAPYAAGDQAVYEQVMKAHQDFGTTNGEVWSSFDEGASWNCLCLHLPEIFSVETAASR